MAKIVKNMVASAWDYAGLKRYKKGDFKDDGTSFKAYIYKDFLVVTYATYQGEKFLSVRSDYSCYNNTDYTFWHDNFKDASDREWEFNGAKEIDLDKLKENLEVIYNALQEAPAKYETFMSEQRNEKLADVRDDLEKSIASAKKTVAMIESLDLLSIDFKALRKQRIYMSFEDLQEIYRDSKKSVAEWTAKMAKVADGSISNKELFDSYAHAREAESDLAKIEELVEATDTAKAA